MLLWFINYEFLSFSFFFGAFFNAYIMAGVFFISIFQVIFFFSDHFNDTPEVSAIFWGSYTIYSFFIFLLGVRITDVLIKERVIDITKIYDEKNTNKTHINRGIFIFWIFIISLIISVFGVNLLLQRYHDFQQDIPPQSNSGMNPVNLSIEVGNIGGGITTAIFVPATIISGILLILRSDITYKNFKYIAIYFLISSIPKYVHDMLFANEKVPTPYPQIVFLVTQIVVYIIAYFLAAWWWKKKTTKYKEVDKISNPNYRKVVTIYFIWLFVYDFIASLLAMIVFWIDEENVRNAEIVFYVHLVYTLIYWIIFECVNLFGNINKSYEPIDSYYINNKNTEDNNTTKLKKRYKSKKDYEEQKQKK